MNSNYLSTNVHTSRSLHGYLRDPPVETAPNSFIEGWRFVPLSFASGTSFGSFGRREEEVSGRRLFALKIRN
jgi:hypothetical protein